MFDSYDELKAAVGTTVGHSDWVTIGQERIDTFADATGDHQWIHVDPERAAQGPFKTTVAHGYLTLSLIPMLAADVVAVKGARMGINYGLNRVRFPAPVPAGARVRATFDLLAVEALDDGGYQVVTGVRIDREGGDKPVCVAETVSRSYP